MLGNLKYEVHLAVINGRVGNPESGVDLRQFAGLELYVNNGTDDLRYLSCVFAHLNNSSCGLAAMSIYSFSRLPINP